MRIVKKMVLGRMVCWGEGMSLVVEVLLLFKKTKANQKWQKRRKSFSWCVHTHTLLSQHSSVHTCKLCFSTFPVCLAQMLMTKTLLTEVLLEVTNEEIFQVAKETHRKATKGLLLFPSVRATVPSSLILRKIHFSTEIRLGYVLTDIYEVFLSDWCIMVILYDKQKVQFIGHSLLMQQKTKPQREGENGQMQLNAIFQRVLSQICF